MLGQVPGPWGVGDLRRALAVDAGSGSGVGDLAEVGGGGVEDALEEGAGAACWGLPITWAGTPCSTITPSSMKMTRSALKWVTVQSGTRPFPF